MAEKTDKKVKKFEFDWKNHEEIARFVNDRSRIVGRKRTGLSSKDQKKLTLAVKHARHLGLLPFKGQV